MLFQFGHKIATEANATCTALWLSTGTACAFLLLSTGGSTAADLPGAGEFRKSVQPILQEYCLDCHGDGASKGNVSFDQFPSDADLLQNHGLW